ncbi:MAG: hypothetical protein IT260_11615, partial [Saprospiraceae bacterium]|nr:hypothetical protein [Saprospiraceae bacterium]
MRAPVAAVWSRLREPVFQEKILFLVRQIVITAVNALSGFVILRGLGKVDYAVYTIVFSLLAIFTNITNVGITPAMSGIGGRVWSDRRRMQHLLNTALRLRVQLGWWFALPFVVYCIWQFQETGLKGWALGVLVIMLLLAAGVQLQLALYSIVLQLNKAVQRLQQNELWIALGKLAGIVVLLFFQSPVPWVVGWICACLWFNLYANRRLAQRYLEEHRETDPQFQKEINGIVRTNFVRTVYWSLEGQISILLCTLFASTESIADIGALGRLSVYFAIFQAFILNYSLPGLAKAQERNSIRSRSQRILGLSLAAVVPILTWAVLHPPSLLWILGSKYQSLEPYLFPYLLAVSAGQLAAVVYQICASKAWIDLNRYYVPLALPLQILLINWLDLSSLSNIVLFLGLNNLFFL